MRKSFLLISFLLCFVVGRANNVNLSNIQIVNNGPDSTYIQFDLSWDNSWRVLNGPANYDGVWVFFKYFSDPDNSWYGLPLNSNATSDYLPTGLAYWRGEMGAVFHRSPSNIGTGSVSFTGVRLSIPVGLPYNVDIKGFAVEMVYVPGISDPIYTLVGYYGDGNGSQESTNAFHIYLNSNLTAPSYYPMSVDVNGFDDSAIEDPNSFFIEDNGADSLGVPAGLNNAYFPTGSPLWCMKYEITQGAYRDFLNTLKLPAQINRTANSPTSATGTGALTTSGNNRNYLEINLPSVSGQPAVYGCDASGNNIFDETNDGEFVACNYISWPDLAAWLDWAGLSPMTEIHFERICRGVTYAINPGVYGEYAWGDTSLYSAPLGISNPFQQGEVVNNASSSAGNAVFNGGMTNGPLRNGIFATSSSNRKTSGSTFYGVMDMSGNLAEPCVTVGNVAGRSYNKAAIPGIYNDSRGDGFLNIDGNANVIHWPGCSTDPNSETDFSCIVTNAYGTILRGGSFTSPKEALRLADRSQGEAPVTREMNVGGRGVIVTAMYEN